MSRTYRLFLFSLALTLSLVIPATAQTPKTPRTPAFSGVADLAEALSGAATEEEQEGLLERERSLVNGSLVEALRKLAIPLINKGDYGRAASLTRIAVRVAERIGDPVGLADALCDLGAVYIRQNRMDDAQEYLRKSLTIFEETGHRKEQARALYNLGLAQNRPELSLEYYDRSMTISREVGDRNLIPSILNSQGLAHTRLGHFELGLELYQKSRALSEELGDRRGLEIAYNNIATHFITQGRYAEALEYLHRSLKINEESGSDGDRRSQAYRLQNIGLIYRRQGRYDQALAYSRRSLKILEEIDDNFGIANLQNNIGVILKSQGDYAEALEWFERSLQRYRKGQTRGGIARSLNNIGDAFRLQRRFDRAEESLRESLRLRLEFPDRSGVSLTLNNLGRLYRDQARYAEMLEVSRRAADLAEELNMPEELWKAQESTGLALRELGDPVEARRHYLEAIATIESLRHEVAGGGQQRQTFLENRLSPWLGMVSLLISRKEYAEALTFAEQSKARVLLDALQEGRITLRESLSPRERQTEEEHRFRLVSLNSQLSGELRREKPDTMRVAGLKAGVDKARLEYEALVTSLYAAHPELRANLGKAPIIRAEELATLLPNASSALIEYVVAEDSAYLFVITKAAGKEMPEVGVHPLSIKREQLAGRVEVFRRQMSMRDLGFRASAAELYRLLLGPAEAQLRGKTSLIIAPDDKLWDLPFQALVTGAGRYLIEDAAISYTPSLTALREMSGRRKPRTTNAVTLLAMGNPMLGEETINRAKFAMRDERPGQLPEAEQEVLALGRLYGRSRSRIYTGAEAREDRVKKEAGQAAILHFATHGVLSNASPMYSHLALARGGDKEDGLLEAWELMQLDFRAELAVLSACETGRGHLGAGEGLIGLTWAMFIAGVPATVVSQWKVESASTRDLMLAFHRRLLASKTTRAEALRQAALMLMKKPETGHPFYWAGFVLVGDGF